MAEEEGLQGHTTAFRPEKLEDNIFAVIVSRCREYENKENMCNKSWQSSSYAVGSRVVLSWDGGTVWETKFCLAMQQLWKWWHSLTPPLFSRLSPAGAKGKMHERRSLVDLVVDWHLGWDWGLSQTSQDGECLKILIHLKYWGCRDHSVNITLFSAKMSILLRMWHAFNLQPIKSAKPNRCIVSFNKHCDFESLCHCRYATTVMLSAATSSDDRRNIVPRFVLHSKSLASQDSWCEGSCPNECHIPLSTCPCKGGCLVEDMSGECPQWHWDHPPIQLSWW